MTITRTTTGAATWTEISKDFRHRVTILSISIDSWVRDLYRYDIENEPIFLAATRRLRHRATHPDDRKEESEWQHAANPKERILKLLTLELILDGRGGEYEIAVFIASGRSYEGAICEGTDVGRINVRLTTNYLSVEEHIVALVLY